MSLDMLGHIDSTFQSVAATRNTKPGSYDADGIWVDGAGVGSPHTVNLQPVSEKETQNLKGAERVVDFRKIYVNDGDLYSISPADEWTFTGIAGAFKTFKLDNRPWRNYCKVIVGREDDS